ncbi:hypothetical protein QEN19_001495 [Hanseniaspora menglaensis]
MYGDFGAKLVQDAKRSRNLKKTLQNNKNVTDMGTKYGLVEYPKDLIEQIIDETSHLGAKADHINQLFETNSSNNLNDKISKCQYFTTILSIHRNKRCLLGYHNYRRENIDEFVWQNLTSIADIDISGLSEKLDMNEKEYLRDYQAIIDDYSSNFPELEIKHKGDYGLEPPKDLYVEVRVLKDGGMVQTEYGVFNLIKDSQIFMRKSDAEALLQQGYLQIIKN